MIARRLAATLSVCLLSAAVHAGIVTVEPDDYPPGADLTSVSPAVTLRVAASDNTILPFPVLAAESANAPTGTRVFSHAGVPFFNDIRRLRMDFTQPVQTVGLLFSGGDFVNPEFGLLQVYNSSNQLLAQVTSAPHGRDTFELLSLNRPQNDIAWALAYTPLEGGSFGRFDALSITVPEPGSAVALGLLTLAMRRRREPVRKM